MVKRAPARRRPRKAKAGSKGLEPAQCRLEQSEGSAAQAAEASRRAGGCVVGLYKEPSAAIQRCFPFFRSTRSSLRLFNAISPTHHKRLADVINKTGYFLDPLIAVLAPGDGFWTPNGALRGVTLVGNVIAVPNTELAEVRSLYLDRHANSKYWVDFEDFSFYRMDVVDVYYLGGIGVMGWVSAFEYKRSRPDSLADSMAEIIQHMNADHKDALILLAREFARIDSEEVTMTAVDRLGFHVRIKTQDGIRGNHIAFSREVNTPEETRQVIVEMVHRARSQAK